MLNHKPISKQNHCICSYDIIQYTWASANIFVREPRTKRLKKNKDFFLTLNFNILYISLVTHITYK